MNDEVSQQREPADVDWTNIDWDHMKGNPVTLIWDDENPGALCRKATLPLKNNKNSKNSKNSIEFREPIWPIWVPQPDSDTTIADFETHWNDASTQARSTAKWIATVLGAALAALIGTAPLAGFRDQDIPWYAYLSGGVGLVLIIVTLALIINVLVPQVTGFGDLTSSSGSGAFAELKGKAKESTGALLPIGITTLDELAGRNRLEDYTLNKLANEIADDNQDHTEKARHETLIAAQKGRAQWLSYLTQTITQWTVIASYRDVKNRADRALSLGLFTGAIRTAGIVLAFLMPTPKAPAVSLATYQIVNNDTAALTARSAIGDKCEAFKGVVVGHDSQNNLTILAQPSGSCKSAYFIIPGKDLVEIAGD